MALKSWVDSANDADTDFPIQNLPYGVFRHRGQVNIGVALGDQIVDLRACASQDLLSGLTDEIVTACKKESLNALMSLGSGSWSALRKHLTALLDATQANSQTRTAVASLLVPMRDASMELPAQIGDYTDFYASIHHATRVGKLFRPDNPLLPNYKYIPIGYHGRASSIVVSGKSIRRPWGQTKSSTDAPVFEPSRSLDYELEVGVFVGPGNPLGRSIPIDEAEQHIFGLCLVNDWSARDIQSWEYQPLGPFLAKSFATTISPWVVPLEALAPYRVSTNARSEADPAPLEYLRSSAPEKAGIDLFLEVSIESERMRDTGAAPLIMSRGNLHDLYWDVAQLITHHSSNGCNLRPGDLLATGTISGPEEGSEGCLLEMKHRSNPIRLPSGELRAFLEDGDRISLRAYAHRNGLPRIGFGECIGTIASAVDRAIPSGKDIPKGQA
jgi:fumarylacetoacetase